jgi:1,2-phenylacetyl-CoA epoxidase catalytic subunit
MDGVKALLETPERRAEVEAVVPKWLGVALASFGRDKSRTNERFRYWGIKTATNIEMREAYYKQIHSFVTRDWRIELSDDLRDYVAA